MIEHDRLFKELLTTFFGEFLDLFCPQLAAALDTQSITFLDKEVFTDVTQGNTFEADILARARFHDSDQETGLCLILVEVQSYNQPEFGKRLLKYFSRFFEKYDLPVYPIVVFTYDTPYREEPNTFQIAFPDLNVLRFEFRVVQLNRLNWRDFVNQPNPVAAALMAKMRIAPQDRWRVKVECLRLLVTLRLNRAKMRLISGFVDSYLRLSGEENQLFTRAVENELPPKERAMALELTTSWKEEGIAEGLRQGIEIASSWKEEGIAEGLRQGLQEAVLRILARRFGILPETCRTQVRQLSSELLRDLMEVSFDFTTLADLETWLVQRAS